MKERKQVQPRHARGDKCPPGLVGGCRRPASTGTSFPRGHKARPKGPAIYGISLDISLLPLGPIFLRRLLCLCLVCVLLVKPSISIVALLGRRQSACAQLLRPLLHPYLVTLSNVERDDPYLHFGSMPYLSHSPKSSPPTP